MEVRTFSNSARPGVGCSVGFLIYPPLERLESFYIGFHGEGADAEFSCGKAAKQVTTPYGIPYGPHYLKKSRARQKETKEGL